MLKYLEAYCDINEIFQVDQFLKIWQEIIDAPKRTVHTFSRYWYIFRAFQELVQEKRDLEAFMTLGDTTSNEMMQKDTLPSEALEQIVVWLEHSSDFDNVLVVVDSVTCAVNDTSMYDTVAQKLTTHWSALLMIR